MILENCCYDWFEMNTLNMAQQGVFGEVIRAQGAYIHNLSPFWNHYWKNGENDKLGWRLDYNMRHRGDVYATHGLGPVAQALDIHRGDRMKTALCYWTQTVSGIYIPAMSHIVVQAPTQLVILTVLPIMIPKWA